MKGFCSRGTFLDVASQDIVMKKRNSTKVVFNAPKFFIEESVVTTGKGPGKRYLVVLNDTVTIIPFTQKKELILVKEYRVLWPRTS